MTVLYSGSFNPLHIGHLAILKALCGRKDVARVLLSVSPQNPLKETPASVSAQARFEAAQAALARHPELSKVEACDIELRLPPPHYTINTLDCLSHLLSTDGEQEDKARETGRLMLAVGGDQLADFRRWKDDTRILLDYGLLVYPREGFDSRALRDDLLSENPAYRILLLDAPEINISSTFLRSGAVEDMEKYLM